MRFMRNPAVLAVALGFVVASCRHASEPPPKAAEETPSLYNEPKPSSSSQHAEAAAAQLLPAQIRITTVLAQALRVGAAIWLTSHDDCPTPEAIVAAHLLSESLRTTDGWDRPYKITCDAKGAVVRSAGPDGVFGNEDDIVVGR